MGVICTASRQAALHAVRKGVFFFGGGPPSPTGLSGPHRLRRDFVERLPYLEIATSSFKEARSKRQDTRVAAKDLSLPDTGEDLPKS